MLLARDIQKGGMKFWVRFAEKYGSPWVIGKHPRGTAQGEIDLLLDSMEAMVEDAVAAIPDDSSIEIKEAAGKADSSDIYQNLITLARSEISIALLGRTRPPRPTVTAPPRRPDWRSPMISVTLTLISWKAR